MNSVWILLEEGSSYGTRVDVYNSKESAIEEMKERYDLRVVGEDVSEKGFRWDCCWWVERSTGAVAELSVIKRRVG